MEEDLINADINCHVCGERDFQQRDGFYYCMECGTKQEQVRLVEVEQADDFNETTGVPRKGRSIKINTLKTEKPQLTSWECYNYILRGYVEELLAMGAKEELKLMTLQVWAAYLRRMEAAFFNKKRADLPRLGVRYLKNDAATIYNHPMQGRRKRKRGKPKNSIDEAAEISGRDWRKCKRKLDESAYSSATSMTSASQMTSSTSAITNRAIRLNFNSRARKILKTRMNPTHLLRHEMDAEGLLQCHKRPKLTELNRIERAFSLLNIKQVYCILAIALNFVGDDIQLCDLVRFIQEGRIGWKNILQYFPENISCDGDEFLRKIDFFKYSEKYTDKTMREHCSLLAKKLHMRKFQTPNIKALIHRYVTELCLPPDIKIYAERLHNFLPPRFDTRNCVNYPAYEARAMAYIIFVLKLLFGLDGQKEKRMSKAAKDLNARITWLNLKNPLERPLLFVWDEWVRYIEMRTIIVSHFNLAFCKQFKQCESQTQIMDEMAEKQREQESSERQCSSQMQNIRSFFDKFLETRSESIPTAPKLEFKHTFTPGLSYFKTILVHCDQLDVIDRAEVKIPDFMRVEHAQRDINSYVEARPLKEYFHNNQLEVKVHCLATTENNVFVGIFRNPRPVIPWFRLQKASYDISDEEWQRVLKNKVQMISEDIGWKTISDTYHKRYFKDRTRKLRQKYGDPIYVGEEEKRQTTHPKSIEMFSENNMEPLKETEYNLKEPARHIDSFNIFTGINDEEDIYALERPPNVNITRPTVPMPVEAEIKTEIIDDDDDEEQEQEEEQANEYETANSSLPDNSNYAKFFVSNMDCWMILGSFTHCNQNQQNQVREKFPPSFRWLLDICSNTIGVEWSMVYQQLLCLETMYGLGVQDLDKVENCVYLKYMLTEKEIQTILTLYREIW